MTTRSAPVENTANTLPKAVLALIRDRQAKLNYLDQSADLFGEVPHCIKQFRKEVLVEQYKELLRLAERMFGNGEPLKIDRDEVEDQLPIVGERHRSMYEVPVDELWRTLENIYGGDAGKVAAKEQLAERLIKSFWLSATDKLLFSKNCLKLNRVVHCTDKARLSHTSSLELRKLLIALADFCRQEALPGLAGRLGEALSEFDAPSYKVTSRKCHEYVDTNDGYQWVAITTYLTRFEYTFSPSLSLAFQQFIAEHGAECLRIRC